MGFYQDLTEKAIAEQERQMTVQPQRLTHEGLDPTGGIAAAWVERMRFTWEDCRETAKNIDAIADRGRTPATVIPFPTRRQE